jgi:hypothetical protein
VGLAPDRPSRVPVVLNVLAQRRCPIHPLQCARCTSPIMRRVRTAKVYRHAHDGAAARRGRDECEVPPLEIGVRAMQLSPYRAGLAGRHCTRLPVPPAFPTCSCPLQLSLSGQSMTQESPFELLLTVSRMQHRVPRRTLSPHTAHERRILWEMSISPAPRSIHRGQLGAFAGYLCTVARPSPSGPSPCTRLSRAPTPMPYLTAWRALEFRWALACLLSTLLHIPSRLSRVQSIGLKAECCRWRVSPCPFHSLWLPRHSMG